jgi:hypothetical protein
MNICKRLGREEVLAIIVEHYARRGMNLTDASITFDHDEDPAETVVSFSAWMVVPQEPTT